MHRQLLTKGDFVDKSGQEKNKYYRYYRGKIKILRKNRAKQAQMPRGAQLVSPLKDVAHWAGLSLSDFPGIKSDTSKKAGFV
jgi:hypothetical protein